MTGGSAEQVAAIRRDLVAQAAVKGDVIDAALFDEWFSAEPLEQSDLAYLLLSLFMPPRGRLDACSACSITR